MRPVDDDAFEEWYRSEHPRLVTLLAVVVGDVDVAREAADESLVRAYERWSRVSQMAAPEGWVYRVALNVARRRTRRRAREVTVGLPVQSSVPGPTGELWLVVSSLPQRQRTAVLLRHVGQLTEHEIAEVMGIARGTVSSTLRAAYRNLRVALTETSRTEESCGA